jgi:hypothetical protein
MRPIPIAQYLAQFGRAEPTEVQLPRRDGALLKVRPIPVREDIEARLEEAFERGRQEGLAAARAEAAEALARDQADREQHALDDRLAFRAAEYAQLADKIMAGLVDLEDRIAASVARILKPYLTQEHSKRVTQALSDNLTRILSGDAPAVLKISGPEYMLSALRERLLTHPVVVEYSVEDGVDVTVDAQQTVIKSQLQAWIDHIESIGD